MNSSSEQESRDNDIEAKAADWLALRDNGFTEQEAAAFAAWCSADPSHRAAFDRLDSVWSALQQLRDVEAVSGESDSAGRESSPTRRWYRPVFVAAGLAACLALALLWSSHRPAGSTVVLDQVQSFATVAGVYQKVTLSDGSMVQLNGGTRLSVSFNASERRVTLREGEAHFSVASNRRRPFRVEARGTEVIAVGTAFNVRLQTDEVEVLVTEGQVQVARRAQRSSAGEDNIATSAAIPPTAGPSLVSAGERLIVSRQTGMSSINAVSSEAILSELAWQVPREIFVDTPLAAVVSRFNQRNRVQLEIEDPELAALPMSGNIRTDNLDAFIRLLESPSSGIVLERPDQNRVILRQKK